MDATETVTTLPGPQALGNPHPLRAGPHGQGMPVAVEAVVIVRRCEAVSSMPLTQRRQRSAAGHLLQSGYHEPRPDAGWERRSAMTEPGAAATLCEAF